MGVGASIQETTRIRKGREPRREAWVNKRTREEQKKKKSTKRRLCERTSFLADSSVNLGCMYHKM